MLDWIKDHSSFIFPPSGGMYPLGKWGSSPGEIDGLGGCCWFWLIVFDLTDGAFL
jgi:hypothetical protein